MTHCCAIALLALPLLVQAANLTVMVPTQIGNSISAELLLPRLLSGSEADYLSLFAPEATVEDVFAGRVQGATKLLAFRSSFVARLNAVRPQPAALQTLRVTNDASASRSAVEQLLPLAAGWAWDSCKAVAHQNSSAEILFTTVADLSPSGLFLAVRLYYPSYPITGQSVQRTPLLSKNASAVTSGAVARYQMALRLGDANAVAAEFEPDGYFREPSGAYHAGAQTGVLTNFRSFFALGRGGGIDLEHCVVTSDGVAWVLEYNCVAWGGVALPPTAGVATYEIGRSKRIMGGRVNDNVQPPAPPTAKDVARSHQAAHDLTHSKVLV